MIRIGILGAGTMAAVHAAAYARMSDIEVVGVFGRSPGRARAVAATCGASPVDGADALIGAPDLDAIDICLPSALHPAFAISALQHGKHVLCETPMALSLAEAESMRDAARQAGRLLQVGLLMRSVDAYAHVKAAAESGRHGRLLGLSAWRLGSYLHPNAPDHKTHYGDPTTELMTFDFDVALWLMGRPARLQALGGGTVTALLGYADGGQATIMASGLMPPGSPFTVGFRALFERAVFRLETTFDQIPPRSAFTVATVDAAATAVALTPRDPYDVELRHFIDCIVGSGDPALLDADRAIEALHLSLATQRALADRQPVIL